MADQTDQQIANAGRSAQVALAYIEQGTAIFAAFMPQIGTEALTVEKALETFLPNFVAFSQNVYGLFHLHSQTLGLTPPK
jgi:hypothetical protein